MRKVIVYAIDNGSKVENGKGPASFHEWGVDYEEFDTGPGNFSTAIVEYSEGSIETVPADDIKFCEAFEDRKYTFTRGSDYITSSPDGDYSEAGIDVRIDAGVHGNRIELRVYGSGDGGSEAELKSAKELRDYVLTKLTDGEPA